MRKHNTVTNEDNQSTLSSKISRRVASEIAKEAEIFEHAQCIITISYTKPIREEISSDIYKWINSTIKMESRNYTDLLK